MQPPATPVKEAIHHLHNELLIIIFAISAFVLALLLYVIVRFRASRNPVPTRTAHNTVIEILWTVVPVLILVIIAIPSFRLMYFMDRVPDAEMTIKVVGNQWFWTYAYPDQGDLSLRQQHHPGQGIEAGPEAAARCRQSARRAGRHQYPGADRPGSTSCTAGLFRPSASSSTRCPAASTRPGCGSSIRAPSTANATRSAASITPSCRSRWWRCQNPNSRQWLVEAKQKFASTTPRELRAGGEAQPTTVAAANPAAN